MLFRNLHLLLLFSSLFLVMVGFGVIIPLMPFLALELGGSAADMGWLLAVWSIAQFLVAPRWGAFSDRRGRRPGIILGLVGFGLGFFFMGLATELWMLYLARVIGGALSASTLPAIHAYVADVTKPEDRARSMGYMGAAFGLGFMLGPSIGAIMAPLGLRFIFMAAAVVGWLTALLIYVVLPEPPQRLSTAWSNQPLFRALRQALTKSYSCLFWLPLLISFAGSALFTVTGFFLMDQFSARESHVGMAFTVNGAVGVISQGLLISWVLRQLGELRTLQLALWASVVGFLAFGLAPSLWLVLVCIALISLGQGLSRPVMTSVLSRSTDMAQGVTMGLMGSFDALGRVLGPLWAGLAYGWFRQAPYVSAGLICLWGLYLVHQGRACIQTAAQGPPSTGGQPQDARHTPRALGGAEQGFGQEGEGADSK